MPIFNQINFFVFFFFLLCNCCMSPLYIYDINTLLDIIIYKYLFHSIGCLIISLIVSLGRSFFLFDVISLVDFFSFFACTFDVISKNHGFKITWINIIWVVVIQKEHSKSYGKWKIQCQPNYTIAIILFPASNQKKKKTWGKKHIHLYVF